MALLLEAQHLITLFVTHKLNLENFCIYVTNLMLIGSEYYGELIRVFFEFRSKFWKSESKKISKNIETIKY